MRRIPTPRRGGRRIRCGPRRRRGFTAARVYSWRRARRRGFWRLAKLAKEWRDQRSQNPISQALFSSAEEKMSPKELLQSAVEGASLGACA